MTWLSPYRWLLYAALAASLLGGYELWAKHERDIGYGKAQAEYTAAALVADKAARAREQSLQSQVTKATQDAQIRSKTLQAAADAARAQSLSLRDQLAANNAKLSALTRDAVNQYAISANLVLADCQRDYQGMAEKTDAAVSDVELLRQAWPK